MRAISSEDGTILAWSHLFPDSRVRPCEMTALLGKRTRERHELDEADRYGLILRECYEVQDF